MADDSGRPMQLGALLAVLLLIQGAGAQQQPAEWQQGTLGVLGFGTTYNAAQGACSYGDLPAAEWPYGALAAIDPLASPFARGVQQGCGICLEVACADPLLCGNAANQSLVVLVTDHCDGCGPDAVFLAPTGYGQLVASSLGQVSGRFRQVNCNPPGNLAVHVDHWQTAGGSWLRLALLDVAGSGDIQDVELTASTSPDSWRPMQRTFGASWELSPLPDAPLDLKATDSSGQTVVARRALLQAGQAGNFPVSAQFQATQNLANALGSSYTPPAPAAQQVPAAQVPPAASKTTFAGFFGTPQPIPSLPPAQAPNATQNTTVVTLPAPAPEAEAPTPSPAAVSPAAAAPLPAPVAEAPALASPALPPLTPAAPAAPPQAEAPATVQLVSSQPATFPSIPPVPAPESSLVPAVTTATPAGAPAVPTLTLPAPSAAAPTVVDTRPPRPPGVGPSVTPAPVVFTPVTGLPTIPAQPAAPGPVPSAPLAAAANVDPTTCLNLGGTLARIPDAANWTQLMRSVGLEVLLQNPNATSTLLVPVNSALGAAIDARPLRNESTLSELIVNAPEVVNPLVGYHVLPGLWPSYTLQPGAKLNTSDSIDKVNPLQITVQGPTSLQGIGTSANILQPDIVTCGPSIIHIVDQVLLPFTFEQAALDAILATQVPQQAAQPAGRR